MPLADPTAHTLSIIIVTYNSLPALDGCLHALIHAAERFPCEIVVVDNASTDSSLASARDHFPSAKIVMNDSNFGFATACNKGAEAADGEFVCFLNPDVQVDPESLVNLVEALSLHPEAGLVSARLRYPDGRFQPTCRQFPTPANIFLSRGSAVSRFFSSGASTTGGYSLPDYSEITEVPATSATFAGIRRDLFLGIGGFDSRYFMYMEDTDLCLRLAQAGHKNLFAPQVGGVHHWWRGGKANIWRRQYYQHHSVWRYFLKHLPNGFTIMLLPFLIVANYLVVCMTAMVTGKSR